MKAHDDLSVVDPAGLSRASVRSLGLHEALHVRQDKRESRVLCCVAAGRPTAKWCELKANFGYSFLLQRLFHRV